MKQICSCAASIVLALALLLVPGVQSAARADSLIVNGSFETGPQPGSFTNIAGGSTAITGWTVTGEGIDYIGSLWLASDGARSLDLDGSVLSQNTSLPFVQGGVAQSFATTAGTSYLVTFDMAGNVFSTPVTKTMGVFAAGQEAQFTFSTLGQSASNMGWTGLSWTFVATGSSTTLEFRSLTPAGMTGWGPALDNVAVTALDGSPTPVPEPGSLLLLSTGAVVVAKIRKREEGRGKKMAR